MSSIYELTDKWQTILDTMEACEGDPEAEAALTAMLEQTSGDIADKGDGYAKIVRNLEAEAEALSTEAASLAAKASARKNHAARLKHAMANAMEQIGADKIKGALFTLALQASPPSTGEVDEAAALAAGMAQEVTSIKVDRKAIIDAWKIDPASVQGIATVSQSRHLRIR